jgi:hypothetical protein
VHDVSEKEATVYHNQSSPVACNTISSRSQMLGQALTQPQRPTSRHLHRPNHPNSTRKAPIWRQVPKYST